MRAASQRSIDSMQAVARAMTPRSMQSRPKKPGGGQATDLGASHPIPPPSGKLKPKKGSSRVPNRSPPTVKIEERRQQLRQQQQQQCGRSAPRHRSLF